MFIISEVKKKIYLTIIPSVCSDCQSWVASCSGICSTNRVLLIMALATALSTRINILMSGVTLGLFHQRRDLELFL